MKASSGTPSYSHRIPTAMRERSRTAGNNLDGQDDDEGLAAGPHPVDARPDERLADALPLERGKDG